MTRALSLIALLAAAPAVAEDRALVVGIDDYAALGATAGLNGAVADAERFAAYLTERAGFAPDAVTVLADGDATAEAILGALVQDLLQQTRPGDRVVFYFAGKGALDPKTKELIALAIGIDARCDGCIAFHVKALVRLGVTREEIAETVAMAVYMGGGPSLMYGGKALAAFDALTGQ